MESQSNHLHPLHGLAWTAGIVLGLLAAALFVVTDDHAVGRLRRLWRELGKGIPPGRWSQAILGSTMRAVASAWGPPPITSAPHGRATGVPQPAYFTADTWYYPIDPARRIGMAIYFARGIVRRVRIIRSPR
jgi:hypothetical protein